MKILNMATTCLLLLAVVITITSATIDCDTNGGGCAHDCDKAADPDVCTCRTGFTPNGVDPKACDAINNCTSGGSGLGVCTTTHSCIKVTGSVEVCHCRPGFTLNAGDSKTCDDNNECTDNDGKGDCDHVCANTPAGSYTCTCNAGFTLESDQKTCKDDDECADNAGKGDCSDVCTNTDGSYKCSCNEGYTLKADNKTCEDINECLVNNGDCEHNCTNTPGSRNCTCDEEYSLMDDGKNCKDNTLTCYIGNGDIGYQHLPTFRNYSCCLKTVTSKPVLQSTVTYSGSKDNSTCNDYCINTLGKVSTMECTCDTNLCNAAPETLVMSVFSIFVAAFVVIAFNIFTLLSIV